MYYYSTRHKAPRVSLAEALFASGAPDGGQYMPESLPIMPEAFFNNFGEMTLNEISYIIADRMLGHMLSSADIKHIVDSTLDFDVPIYELDKHISVLELFHGPTLAFKDFGSRFMARTIELLASRRDSRSKINIIVSTTGNTGAAVANAFAGVGCCEVFILFPPNSSNRSLQRQFTTLGGNIHAIEVQGTIDNCARLARQALSDPVLTSSLTITSANSANILRLFPQIFYIFYGVSRLIAKGHDARNIVPAIPSGNLSNVTAAIFARRMGLECAPILAAENANTALTSALKNGGFERRHAVATLAYAADKGRPSCADRLLDIYGGDMRKASSDIEACSVSDLDVIRAVNSCYAKHNYLLDPHSALAYHALTANLKPGQHGLLFATAHPAKSLPTMTAITGNVIDLPLQINAFLAGRDHRVPMSPDYRTLRKFILHFNNQ